MHQGRLVADPPPVDAAVPFRRRDRGEGEQRRRARVPGQQLQRDDRYRGRVESAAEQQGRGFGGAQRTADGPPHEFAGGLDVIRVFRQAHRRAPFGQIVIAANPVRVGRDREHLAGQHGLDVPPVGRTRLAVTERHAFGDTRVVEAAREVAPREDGARDRGDDGPALGDVEEQGRRPQRGTERRQDAPPGIPDHGGELPFDAERRLAFPALPGAGEEIGIRQPAALAPVKPQRRDQVAAILEGAIEQDP